jgi:hypothetical protein
MIKDFLSPEMYQSQTGNTLPLNATVWAKIQRENKSKEWDWHLTSYYLASKYYTSKEILTAGNDFNSPNWKPEWADWTTKPES